MFTWIQQLFGIAPKPRVLKADGDWGFTATLEGNDIVVRGAVATWFGGTDDPEDDGETASGINTRKRPSIQACALPMNFGPCKGSPLPRMPWGTKVEVFHVESGEKLTVPLIDLGPSRGTGHALDLTPAAFVQFAPISKGKITVDYRIVGGTRWLAA